MRNGRKDNCANKAEEIESDVKITDEALERKFMIKIKIPVIR